MHVGCIELAVLRTSHGASSSSFVSTAIGRQLAHTVADRPADKEHAVVLRLGLNVTATVPAGPFLWRKQFHYSLYAETVDFKFGPKAAAGPVPAGPGRPATRGRPGQTPDLAWAAPFNGAPFAPFSAAQGASSPRVRARQTPRATLRAHEHARASDMPSLSQAQALQNHHLTMRV